MTHSRKIAGTTYYRLARDDHPDSEAFIVVPREAARLVRFVDLPRRGDKPERERGARATP